MSIWRWVKSRLPWFRRRLREPDLDRGLRTHVELEAEDQAEAGVPPEETQCPARRALGNTAQTKEDLRTAWGFQRLETLL